MYNLALNCPSVTILVLGKNKLGLIDGLNLEELRDFWSKMALCNVIVCVTSLVLNQTLTNNHLIN